MSKNQLQPGQIIPAAKPIKTFFGSKANFAPAPAKPQLMGDVSRINVIQRGNVANVQGYNSLEQLSQVVKQLVPVVDTGLKLYGSNEYQKGQQLVLEAIKNNNQATDNSAKDYATKNRELERINPLAALEMDDMNPYRRAGAIRQASKITAQLVPAAFDKAWNDNSGLLSLRDPGDPLVAKVTAKTITDIAGIYGLDETSTGFMEEVIPVINKEKEKFQNKQYKAYVKNNKIIKQKQTTNGLLNLLETSKNPVEAQGKFIELMKTVKDYSGVNGETLKILEKSILDVGKDLKYQQVKGSFAQRRNAEKLYNTLLGLPTPYTGKNGLPLTVDDVYGDQLYIDTDKVDRIVRDRYKNQQLNLKINAQVKYGKLLTDPNFETRRKAEQELLTDPDFQELDIATKNEIVQGYETAFDETRERSVNTDKTDAFLSSEQNLIGSDWKPDESFQRFLKVRKELESNPEEQLEFSTEYYQLVDRKQKAIEKSFNPTMRNDIIKNSLLSILEDKYPSLKTAPFRKDKKYDYKSILSNQNILQKEGAAIVGSKLEAITLDALRDAVRDEKFPDNAELPQEIQRKVMLDAIEKYKDSDEFKADTKDSEKLLDKSDNATQVYDWPPETTFFKSNNVITPERMETWKSIPLYDKETTESIYKTYADKNGYLPIRLRQAAASQNISPEELMLKNVDLHKFETDWVPNDEEREEILRNGNQAKGFIEGSFIGAPTTGALANASRVFDNILNGTSTLTLGA